MRRWLQPGPGWLILTVVAALFSLEVTALSVASHAVSRNNRAADLLRLLERVDGTMRAITATSGGDRAERMRLLRALSPGLSLAAAPLVKAPVASDDELAETEDILLNSVAPLGAVEVRVAEEESGTANAVASFTSSDPGPVETGLSRLSSTYASSGRFIASIQLSDGTWLNLTSPRSPPPALLAPDALFWYLAVSGLIVAASIIAVRQLTAPYRQLERAVTEIGHDLRVAPIDERGNAAARRLIRAINIMQERLKAHVEDYEYLAVALAHDLRTPLTRMRLRSELIGGEAGGKISSDLHDIEQIVTSVLEFARSGLAARPEAVELRALAEAAAEDFPAVAVEQGSDGLPILVRSDPTGLRRCLQNLMQNACRHGSEVRVILEDQGEEAVIVVEDDGPGIRPADLPQVTRPFFRGEASRNRASGGIGLGLAITSRIVQSLGGELHLANRSEGGLRATIRLPRNAAA